MAKGKDWRVWEIFWSDEECKYKWSIRAVFPQSNYGATAHARAKIYIRYMYKDEGVHHSWFRLLPADRVPKGAK